jgi:DNA replication protein DnaC
MSDLKEGMAELMEWCKRGVWYSGQEEGLTEEEIQKRWDRTLWEMENEEPAPCGGNLAQQMYKQDEKVMNSKKEHIIHCLPEKYKRVIVEDWTTPTKEYISKKEAALRILSDHYLQVWQGDTARGKSMLAAGIAKRAAQTGMRVHYESTPTGLHALFKSESTQDTFGDWKTLPQHVMDLSRYDLLIIEDWNFQTMNGFQQEGWFTLLKKREEGNLRTVLITNNDDKKMKTAFSVLFDKVYRRITERGCWINFGELPQWKDFKQQKFNQTNSVQDAVQASMMAMKK